MNYSEGMKLPLYINDSYNVDVVWNDCRFCTLKSAAFCLIHLIFSGHVVGQRLFVIKEKRKIGIPPSRKTYSPYI